MITTRHWRRAFLSATTIVTLGAAVRGGTLDFTSMATGLIASLDKRFLVFDLAFLLNDVREAYGALESRAIDGQDNPVTVIESAKLAEVQKCLSLTRHVYAGMPFLMSKKTWDGMSGAERGIIREAADHARDEECRLAQAKEGQGVAALEKVMQANIVSDAEIRRLRQKVQPVTDRFSREIGEDVVSQVNAELSRLRGTGKAQQWHCSAGPPWPCDGTWRLRRWRNLTPGTPMSTSRNGSAFQAFRAPAAESVPTVAKASSSCTN